MIPTTEDYIARIKRLAVLNPTDVTLTIRPGSGKTRELWVTVGAVKRCVAKMHVRLHKTLNAIVQAARDWLAQVKAMFNVRVESVVTPVALIPATVNARSDQQKLVMAAARLPQMAGV